MRPELDVRSAFCEQTSPHLSDVLRGVEDGAVVTPLLLASAYHARIDIPAIVEASARHVRHADVLGEDDRLISVMRQRLAEAGVSQDDSGVGVVVVAVGSSWDAANVRTARVAATLSADAGWTAATAFATGPQPRVAPAVERLRRAGLDRVVIAPWFLAHGRITDRVAEFARAHAIEMTQPLGVHHLVAETVLDRYDEALATRVAA